MICNFLTKQLFQAFPLPSVLLKANAPIFTIVAVNSALLNISHKSSESELLGKGLFEVFPDNPNDPTANGVNNLSASLEKTINTGTIQEMPRQKFDLPVPNTTKFETRYWLVKNTPLFNEANVVEYIIHTTEDITQKVLLEEKEKELAILIAQKNIILKHTESINEIGNWDLDIATGEFTWSPEFFKMCGYEPNAFVPTLENAIQIIHPEDLEKVRAVYLDSIENGSAYRIEHRIIRADGYVILVLAVGIAIKNADNKPIKLTGLFQNITSSKQLETMLRQNVSDLMASESRYKKLFENNPSPMYIWDFKSQKIVDCNEEALLLYGYTREEFLSLSLKDIRPREDIYLLEALTHSEESYSRIEKKIWRHKKKNGDIIYLHIVGHLFNYNGKKVSLVSLNDFTEKIRAEEALKESETRYKSFFNNSLDANLLSIENGKILAANPVACKMFGYTEEEFCKLTRQEITDTTDKRLISLLHAKKLTGHGESIHRFIKKDGSTFEAFVSSTEYKDIHGEIRNAVIIKNIDEKLRAEAALAESDKKYRLLFYKSPIPKWIYEENTLKILDVNEVAMQHYGYSRAEFLNLTIKDLRPEEELPKLMASYNKKRDSEKLYKAGTFVHKKKNGTRISVEISSIPIEYGDKKCKLITANDVSDVAYALKELALSIERYHYVTKATSDAIWDLNLENNTAIWGEGFESIFGYDITKITSDISFITDNIHPEDKDRVLEGFYTILNSNEKQWQDEYRFKKADSTYAYTINKAIVIRNEMGRTIRIVGGMQDITIRKKELLRLKLLESVVTNATDMVAITDANMLEDQGGPRIIYINAAYSKITGYTLEDVIGKTPRILQGPKTDRKELNKLKIALQNQQPCTITVINYKKNGEEFWSNISVSPVKNANDTLTHWVAIKRDITKQKEEEQRLQLLESVITNTSDMVIITEAEPIEGEGPKIIYVNDAFMSGTGYSKEDVIGKTPRLLQGPKTDKQELEKLKKALQNWQSCNITVLNYKKNGDEFWNNMSISPVADANGWYTHWIAVERDITERVQRNADIIHAIIKTQEEERYEVGAELHDNVCQILTSSKISFKMLESVVPDNKRAIFNDGIETLNLTFKEIRNLSHRLAPAFFKDGSLEESLKSLVHTFNIEDKYNINLTFDDNFKSHTTSREFQLNIYRILQEQLRNILKYAKAKNILIAGITTANALVLTIMDDGIGFNPKTIKSGIGLANMKRRVELFGGKLLIDSELGKGCTITVEIPLTEIN
jgi:PAS domain S-box-containing protein